jgi:hypothetical protein
VRLARKPKPDRHVTAAYGPAVIDREPAADTLAEAERALREGDARRAEETYLRALGKLGPFAEPIWRSGEGADARTRAQCHARLAAIAFDERDFERSLRETSLAAAARHEAIEVDRCTGDDIRFMITALVHSATVHERLGSQREALESSAVALEFARFARTHDHDPTTRRSIAAAQRAAARLHDELIDRQTGSDDAEQPSPDVTRQVIGAVMEADRLDGGEAPADDQLVIDLTDGAVDPFPSTVPTLEDLALPDQADPLAQARDGWAAAPERPEFADLIDLTEPATGDEPPRDGPAIPDLIDLVEAAAQAEAELAATTPTTPTARVDRPLLAEAPDATSATGDRWANAFAGIDAAPVTYEDEDEFEDDDDDRFARPGRRDERRARVDAGPVALDDAAASADTETSAGLDEATDPTVSTPVGERRQVGAGRGESAAQLVGRSRGQALLARVLQGHSDSEAAINAHRAVRTATRARQWAKEDPSAMPVVALNLIEALVTRSDVLVSTGHDEVARSDLRRARAIAEQLWQACPSATSAAAAVLVAVRSASLDAKAGLRSGHLDQLELARGIVERAAELDGPWPDVLSNAGHLLDPEGPMIGRDQLVELGDRLLDHLQAQEAPIDQVAATVG